MFTDRHDKDAVKFEKVKVQNSVGLKYKFYKAILKVSYSGEVSVNQENWTAGIPLKRRAAGALFPIITTWSRDFDKYLYLKYSYTHMCKCVGIFQSHITPL